MRYCYSSLQRIILFIFASIATLNESLNAQSDGTLDVDFGDGGCTSVVVDEIYGLPYGLIQQSDGKILVGGNASDSGCIVRYNEDGTIDEGFATGGINVISEAGFTNAVQPVNPIAVTNEGKIYMILSKLGIDNYKDVGLVRLSEDGTIDTGFSQNGFLDIQMDGTNEHPVSVIMQLDGKIVIVAYSGESISSSLMVIRLMPDGEFDTDFSDDGIFTFTVNGYSTFTSDAVVMTNGDILIGGKFRNPDNTDLYLLKLDESGNLVNAFGGGQGFAILQPGEYDDYLIDIVVDNNSRILLIGSYGIESSFRMLVARLTVDGTLDTNFAENGYWIGVNEQATEHGQCIKVQADSKILFSGSYYESSDLAACIVRINDDGTFDNTFGESGIVAMADDLTAKSFAITEDNKIVAAIFTNPSSYKVCQYHAGIIGVENQQTISLNTMSVFPTATSDFLTLKCTGKMPASVNIVAMDGRQWTVPITNAVIDVRHLAAAVYVLSTKLDGVIQTVRFVRE